MEATNSRTLKTITWSFSPSQKDIQRFFFPRSKKGLDQITSATKFWSNKQCDSGSTNCFTGNLKAEDISYHIFTGDWAFDRPSQGSTKVKLKQNKSVSAIQC